MKIRFPIGKERVTRVLGQNSLTGKIQLCEPNGVKQTISSQFFSFLFLIFELRGNKTPND